MENHEYFMRLALEEAQVSYFNNDVPIGAVLVIDGKIISKGHNTKVIENNPLGHAEINCINEACRLLNTTILENATLYVTLEPCMMCAGLILNTRISNLVYAANEPKFGVIESVCDIFNIEKYKFNHKINITSGVLKEESSLLLKTFFKELRTK